MKHRMGVMRHRGRRARVPTVLVIIGLLTALCMFAGLVSTVYDDLTQHSPNDPVPAALAHASAQPKAKAAAHRHNLMGAGMFHNNRNHRLLRYYAWWHIARSHR